ncbi:MAG: DUF3791 domain-containing protein [Fibromonadaceae bacterium]|jgi:hypothetical protein|nr:DUF3791 domain-containing protein [Fibromonadaceae bacterium]
MDKKQMEFSVFCIESIAEKLGQTGDVIYEKLTKESNILNDYIVSCYDVLHTQGKEYIVDDIIGVMKQKGVKISS